MKLSGPTVSSTPSATNLMRIHDLMFEHFGPQHWWPGDTPFEVAVGAVLTQNTNWLNVERAIVNLKKARALSARRIDAMQYDELAALIVPAGYYNVKARRLKSFVQVLCMNFGASMKRMGRLESSALRSLLLSVNGIGPETADSIMLYALEHPVFVIDAYTKRILPRHGILNEGDSYEDFQGMLMQALPPDVRLYNEYHALLVMTGKHYCRPRKPRCNECPLKNI